MRTSFVLAMAIGCVAAVAVSPARAQVKGAGKVGISIIRWDDVGNVPVSGKAAGSIQTKPKLGVTGFSPTGGSTTSVKLPFQAGPTIDPLKPGFPVGDYVLQIETSQTPTGNEDVTSYVVLTMSSLGKCTALAGPTVDGDAPTDWCGQGGNPPCAPSIADKCTYTTYQVAASLSPLAPLAGVPSSSRMILRKRVANCLTSDLRIGAGAGVEVRPNNAGSFDAFDHDCADGAVVGVFGVANGDTGY